MDKILSKLGISEKSLGGFNGEWLGSGKPFKVISPINGKEVANVTSVTKNDYENIITAAGRAFQDFRKVPAPKRGELVRQLGVAFRENKEALAELITIEMGKCYREGLGEVQEMIDVCDFAVGLSRQLYGLTMPSERESHRIIEQWHSLGVVGVISAFNFPTAVWSWNAALALVCGNTVIWKPSSKTPLSAIACIKIAAEVLERNNYQKAILSLMIGKGSEVGDFLNTDKRVALVSYTGSVAKGRHVGLAVQERFGKSILELGGNAAVIVSDKADMNIALKSVYMGAIGTSGQRCTTTRRVIIHEKIYFDFMAELKKLYQKTAIGNPMEEKNIMGPLVDTNTVKVMMDTIEKVKKCGGKVIYGGEKLNHEGGCYVTPCIMEASNDCPIVKEETFAPILYVMKYKTLGDAIYMQNSVAQGLSSAIITNDFIESQYYLSVHGSDCGLANVNAGTIGAEIGGAFGGEKETGGGRESGSDAWKSYMRRQTSVINYSGKIELAQGIKFF